MSCQKRCQAEQPEDWQADGATTTAGVSFEDRQDLLGHRSGRITTHYSAAELSRLVDAANPVCEKAGNVPELVVLRRLSISKVSNEKGLATATSVLFPSGQQ